MKAKDVPLFLVGSLSIVVGAVLTCPAHTAELAREQVCEQWTQNAVIGAGRALQGAPRKLVPMNENQVGYLLQHRAFFDVQGIVVWAKNYDSEREFLEDSTFYGYDWANRTQVAGGVPDAESAKQIFFSVCMSRNTDR